MPVAAAVHRYLRAYVGPGGGIKAPAATRSTWPGVKWGPSRSGFLRGLQKERPGAMGTSMPSPGEAVSPWQIRDPGVLCADAIQPEPRP